MKFKIEILDTFIAESIANGVEIDYHNFRPLNENYISESGISIPRDVFEAYLKYREVFGPDMVSINEFEKIKSFSEFIASKDEEPAEEPAAEEPAAEEPAADTGSKEPSIDLNSASPIEIQPEEVLTQKEESKDDHRQQTSIPKIQQDGKKTADAIEDEINDMGEPEKENPMGAEHLEDKGAPEVAPVEESEVETQPEEVEPIKGEDSDRVNGTVIDQESGDGQATADTIEDEVNDMGEPEKENPADGEELEDEAAEVTPVAEKKTELEADFIIDSLLNEAADLGQIMKIVLSGSPIKGTKIVNNLKKWGKGELDLGAIEMDKIRKTQAGTMPAKGSPEAEKLTAANNAKIKAIKDKQGAIEDRMNQLASGNSMLGKLVSLGKTKAKRESAAKLMKIAQGEEAEALKLKIQDYDETITTASDELKKYQKDTSKEDAAAQDTEQNAQANAGRMNPTDGPGKKETPAKGKNKENLQAYLDTVKGKLEKAEQALAAAEAEPAPDQKKIDGMKASIAKHKASIKEIEGKLQAESHSIDLEMLHWDIFELNESLDLLNEKIEYFFLKTH